MQDFAKLVPIFAFSLATLAGCNSPLQKLAAKSENKMLAAEQYSLSSEAEADCESMPSNSAKSNCIESYKSEASDLLVQKELQRLINKMDDLDREWVKKTWYDSSGEPSYRQALEQSQATWIKFRDAQCNLEGYGSRGGTSQPQLGDLCQQRLNKERVAQFKKMNGEF